MNCTDIRDKIREAVESDRPVGKDEPLARHIAACELCRRFYSDLVLDSRLTRSLEEMPVPELPADFAARMVRHAVSRRRAGSRRKFFMGLSAAAALIITIGVSIMIKDIDPADTVATVAIPVGGGETVRIRIDAVEPRKNATLAIALAGDVELEGFPDRHQIQWQADLSKGGNLLTIPLMLKDRDGGAVNVRYNYNGTEKAVRIRVRAKESRPVQT